MSAFVDYLRSHIGDAYVWGAQGENITDMLAAGTFDKWLSRRESGNAKQIARVNRFVESSTKTPLCAVDCSGLMVNYALPKGIISSDTTANGLYLLCKKKGEFGTIANYTPKECDLLFIRKGLKMVHVGAVASPTTSIEAYGRDRGVCEYPITSGEWTHWGRLPGLSDEAETADRVLTFTTPMMRGDDVKALQTALNKAGFSCGAADGIYGGNTHTALKEFQAWAAGMKMGYADEITLKLLGVG
jgi:hypothetical protein